MLGALPGAVTLRKVSPRSTAAQDPQNRVEHLPRVTPLTAGGLRGRKKIENELPLPLVEFVSSYHGSSVAAESFFVVLRQSLVPMLTRWLLAFFIALTVLLTILGVLLFLPA